MSAPGFHYNPHRPEPDDTNGGVCRFCDQWFGPEDRARDVVLAGPLCRSCESMLCADCASVLAEEDERGEPVCERCEAKRAEERARKEHSV